MSGLSLSSSSSGTSSSSSDSSNASASSGSSAPSTSVRLSPLAEAEEGDVAEVCADGGRSPLNVFVGADQLMLDLELLGFSCLEAEAVEGVAQAEASVVVVGAFDKGGGEGKKVADDCRMREREAEEVGGPLESCILGESVVADGWPTTVGDFEKRGKLRDWAEESHLGEGKESYFDQREKTGGEADRRRSREGKESYFDQREKMGGEADRRRSREGRGVEAEKGHLGEGEENYFDPREKTGGEAERRRSRERR